MSEENILKGLGGVKSIEINGTKVNGPFNDTSVKFDGVNIQIGNQRFNVNDRIINITVNGDVENVCRGNNITVKGDVDGDEVIQVYIGSDNKEADRPVKVLKGFKRVSVKAKETATAEVEVLIADIKFYNIENGNWELDESYTVYVGTDSKNVTEAGKITF